jgi:hypothetical protein
MKNLKVQLNHPGHQKNFEIGRGYYLNNDIIIREWNKDQNHYRKFIVNEGEYVNSLVDVSSIKSELYFWGEWEGNSQFESINNKDTRKFPNGVHKPFHSDINIGTQNTDPYIYGDFFKYATCKQTGALYDLEPGSVILFGSTYPSLGLFYLDTVFVVKSHETAISVFKNGAKNYTKTYIKETLEQLGNEYIGVTPSKLTKYKKLYHGQSWYENTRLFSFVPCKISKEEAGFERLALSLNDPILKLSKNATGKSFLPHCNLSPQEVWNYICKNAIEQGFLLGIKFNEPEILNL